MKNIQYQRYYKKIFCILFLAALCFFIINTNIAMAGSKSGEGVGGAVTLPDPLGMEGEEDVPQKLIGKIINAILGIVGSLALVMFIYGGFTWMLAAGNQEKVQKGKDILIWATIGLIVIFSAYALVKFVFTGLGVT
jgi:hypothetical protein